jgi:hypothetical protein
MTQTLYAHMNKIKIKKKTKMKAKGLGTQFKWWDIFLNCLRPWVQYPLPLPLKKKLFKLTLH